MATLQEFLGAEGTVFEPLPGRQSLVYRVKGEREGAPSLAFVPHLDVVPADPSGWSVDPFAAEIIDGMVYGRGAVDMLNVVAAMATALRPYINGDAAPAGDLILCAVADEESGGVLGAKHLVDNHWELVGADYVLTEVAYPGLPANGHRRVPVSVGEKGTFWSRLEATGTPGHGSAPYGTDNAIEKVVSALKGIFDASPPADIGEAWLRIADSLGLEDELVARLGDVDTLDGAIDEIAASDPDLARFVHASTHLTISPNLLEAGTQANVIADRGRVEVDIRGLPGMDRDLVDAHLRKAMGVAGDSIDIRPLMDTEATVSDTSNPLWEAIASGVEDLEGHRDLVPTLMTVATDARFWRQRGTVCYGVGLYDERLRFSEMLSLFHGDDERVSADSVDRTAALYDRVLHHFAS